MKASKGAVEKVIEESNNKICRASRSKAVNPYTSKAKTVSKIKVSPTSSPAAAAKRSYKKEGSLQTLSCPATSLKSLKNNGCNSVSVEVVTPASSVDEARMNCTAASDLTSTTDSDDFGIYKLSNDLEKEINKLDARCDQLEKDGKDLDDINRKLLSYKNKHTTVAAKGKPCNIVPVINDRDLDEIWKKASVESNKINDKMVLLCSRPVLVDDVFKVVFFPLMTDKKGELYWCYKAEIFGFHNRCVADIFGKADNRFPVDLFVSYDEVFKRGQGDTIEVPMKMKTSNYDPEKVGNRILFYVHTLTDNTVEELDGLIDSFTSSLVSMHQHPEYCKLCLEKTFLNYGGKFSDLMRTSMMNDKTFTRVLSSGNIHVERNVALYDVTNTDGVRYVMSQVFKQAKPPLATWGYSLKSFCFQNGVVPKGFLYPN